MSLEDDELLVHYLRCGAEPWNGSTESLWLEYELRAWIQPRLPARRPLTVCNVGIGMGLWDDWMGHVLGLSITSIDRDPLCCRMLELRQRREGHPHPANVVCADVFDRMPADPFDVITVVGTTLRESGDRDHCVRTLRDGLAPSGALLIGEVGEGAPPAAATVRCLGSLWLAFSSLTRDS